MAPKPNEMGDPAKIRSFFHVVTTEEARRRIGEIACVKSETVATANAAGRVLATDLTARGDLPHFNRANMDGYAVLARDTFGASASVPAYLELSGVIEMGQHARKHLRSGQAMRISTGGMLPPGADAVVMIEYTEEIEGDAIPRPGHSGCTVEIQRGAAPWEHVLRVGEDIAKGATLFHRGRRLRPRDLGALTGVGVTRVRVHRRPRVGLISTGNEIIGPAAKPKPGQVRNINAYSLLAMIDNAGACAKDYGVIRDQSGSLHRFIERALRENDAVIISGGSSVGVKDITLEVLRALPRSEIIFHGISVAPGKPTILARALGKPVLGLPGHPMSALVIFDLFGEPFLRVLGGEDPASVFRPQRTVQARLARNIASKAGREDYVRVRLDYESEPPLATPMAGKSGAIFNLVQADGLVRVPATAEGLDEDTAVAVILL